MTTFSPSSNYRIHKASGFYPPHYDIPIVASTLIYPCQQQSTTDDPVPAGIFSIDDLDDNVQTPKNDPSYNTGPFEEFEAIISEPLWHTPKSHIMDHEFSQTEGGSLNRSSSLTDLKMTQKRRSLQSLFTPSFLHHSPPLVGPTSSTPSAHGNVSRMRSYSSAMLSVVKPNIAEISTSNSPPLGFLLDDDPFAKLAVVTTASSGTSSTRTGLPTRDLHDISPDPRRSLLHPAGRRSSAMMPPTSFIVSTSPSTVIRTRSHGSTPARSAHGKPAFTPRPSLPSLHTLAQANVVTPNKVRKGKVGGNLPYEPWESDMESMDTVTNHCTQEATTTPVFHAVSTTDSNSYKDFLDFSDDGLESDVCKLPFEMNPSLHHSNLSPNPDFYDQRTASTHFPSFDRTFALSRSSSSSGSSSDTTPQKQGFGNGSTFSTIIRPQLSPTESDIDTLSSPPDLGYFSSATSQIDCLSDQDHDLDVPSRLLWPSDRVTPRTSSFSTVEVSNDHGLIEKWGGSVRDSLPSSMHRQSALLPERHMQSVWEEEAMDGSGQDRAHGENGNGYSRNYGTNGGGGGGGGRERDNRSGGGNSGIGGFGGWNQPSGSGNGGGGRRGNDGDGQRSNSSFSTPLESDTSSSEDEQTSTDDYGADSPRKRLAPGINSMPDNRPGSDDDVPLAQRIPTALRAQRTIRRQVRDERNQRRQDRLALQEHQAQELGPSRPRQQTLRPVAVSAGVGQTGAMSSSHDAALHGSASIKHPRTKKLPSNSCVPFAPEELARKLLDVENGDSLPPRKHDKDTFSQLRNSPPAQFNDEPQLRTTVLPSQDLRSVRSFHRPSGRQTDNNHSIPVPLPPKLNRSVTTSHNQCRDEIQTLREENKRPNTSGGYTPRISTDTITVAPGRNVQRRVMTPVPPAEALANLKLLPPTSKVPTVQQRIFIGDMQRFSTIEVEPSTNAGDVLRMLQNTGGLAQVSDGGWMLWEVAQDFGMERPIRTFELLSDITASWNVDKLVNMIVVKVTYLAPLLSRSAIPESSPKYGSWVQWESKRGKWNKRWMELREHGLWLSKRETGKDEMFLCSLSTFDAYYVTRLHKAPKPFVFAVKSTENLSLFENTADYVHIFSCRQKEGEKFMEMILQARSYVLFQERNVLFNKPNGGPVRSGTRKHPATNRPTQPLVQVSAPFTVTTTKTPFEPGSLLANHEST